MVQTNLPINLWHSIKGGAVFVSDNVVHLFSENGGVLWKADIGEDLRPRSITAVDAGVLLNYWLGNGVGVMLLDIHDGKVLWKHNTIVKKKKIFSPEGILIVNDTVLYSVGGKLISVNLRDGSERFTADTGVKDQKKSTFRFLLERGGKAVLLGDWNVRAHDINTGDVAWGFMEFETPLKTYKKYKAFATRMMAAAMEMQSVMQNYIDTAGKVDHLGRPIRHSPGAQQYHLEAQQYFREAMRELSLDWNLNMVMLTRDYNRKQAVAKGKPVHSLDMIGMGLTANPGKGRGGMSPEKFGAFMNSRQKFVATTFEGEFAVVNLETGSATYYTVLSGGTQCSPVAFADSSISRLIEIYQPVGFFCKEDKIIDVLRLPPPE
jgi:hypothetical protein